MEKCNNMKNASEYILSKQQDKICLVSELAPTQEWRRALPVLPASYNSQ